MFIRVRNWRSRLVICAKFLLTILIFHALEFIVLLGLQEKVILLDLHECYKDELPGIISKQWNNWDNTSTTLEDVLLSDIKPIPGRTIFFLETKCQSPDYTINLTARQICSIESAARNNPNFQVFVIFASPKILDRNNRLIKIIQSYKNVHLRQLNIWRYAKDTPVEDWVIRDNKFLSRYPTEQASDLLRLLTVYRFGGIYMDMDVVVLRSLEQVPLNYVGAQVTNVISNAVISLEPTGIGHEIGELFLRDFQQNFNGTYYLFNGPMLIERVLAKICGTKYVTEMINNPKRCHGMRLYDPSAFFILQNLSYFFDPRMMDGGMEQTKNSYLVHLWNKGSQSCPLKIGSSTTYARYAELHCPRTYATAGLFF